MTVIRNLPKLRSMPIYGQYLYEALTDLDRNSSNVEQQVNGNSSGQVQPPPSIQGLNVTAADGIFEASVAHSSNFYRGVRYYLEHADNPQFTNSHTVPMGDSRNWRGSLGSVGRYFRAYASYTNSGVGAPVYFGGSQPQYVDGSVSNGGQGPAFHASQGSGTGAPGQGLSGPGPTQYRGANPPTRVTK